MIKVRLLSALFLIIICPCFKTFSQEIAIGDWRDHLPYNSSVSVTSDGQSIWCATPYSLFYFNKEDNSINRFTSISGLSDIGISEIGFSDSQEALVIAYSNANLDIIKNHDIHNMRDIIESGAITPEEKTINNILFINNMAYLSCGFGIVVLDLESEEISDTYYIGPDGSHLNVYDLTVNDTAFIAATESGIYSASVDDPNLAYFESWHKDLSMPFPDNPYNHIAINDNRIYVNKYTEAWAEDTIYYYDNSQWLKTDESFAHDDVFGLKVYNNQLYCIHTYYINVYDVNLNKVQSIWTYNYQKGPNPTDLFVEGGNVWIADNQQGLVKYDTYGNATIITPNGPGSADVFNISAAGNSVWAVPGGRNLSWGSTYRSAGIYSFVDNQWSSHDKKTDAALDTIYDCVIAAVNPFNNQQVFIGCWSRGIVELNNGSITNVYSPLNSGLDYKNNEGPPICNVGGLAFDGSGRLWATSSHANNILAVRVPDGSSLGQWYSYNLGSFSSTQDLGQVIIDTYNQKWILVRAEHSLMVFNDNGTLSNTGDDMVKLLTQVAGGGGIPGNKVYSLACDNDGEVWVGTDEGIAVFYSPGNIFSSSYNYDAQRILIPRNDGTGLADILLEFETITAIAIDGDNNKWIGTDRSGVFEMSPDGLKQLQHFTMENSPLFSDNITSLAIDGDGEIFIGTAKGIISYKGRATPDNPQESNVYAYPNPVRPGYTGLIAIRGLPENSLFKITDVSGSLIYSGESEGTQAIWDGNNFSGRRAQTGVYFVFVASVDGSEKMVTKILFVN
jgi:hypothetical protein